MPKLDIDSVIFKRQVYYILLGYSNKEEP